MTKVITILFILASFNRPARVVVTRECVSVKLNFTCLTTEHFITGEHHY